MPKKLGLAFLFIGLLFIIAALALFLFNYYEDSRAGEKSDEMLSELQHLIVEKNAGETSSIETPASTSLTVIDGYVGYLSIPRLDLELPVMDEWDYDKLKLAPCRHFGAPQTDDFVIAAHNYKNHFGSLSKLESKDPVLFTDMDGVVHHYELSSLTTLAPNDVEVVQNSEHDLVLYTCTYGGKTRVAAFFDRPE
ncbi:MAG: sortase [Coriobacteriia bacterium]|nr:sortase [Coriobacteriia bacterium]